MVTCGTPPTSPHREPMTPDKRLTLPEAACASERSISTLRRWLQQGKLTRFEGEPPVHGGSRPTLIDRSELMIHLASTGQTPQIQPPLPRVSTEIPHQASTDVDAAIDKPISMVDAELWVLKERLAAAHEIAQVKLDAAHGQLNTAQATITSLEIRLQEETRRLEQERQQRADAELRCKQLEIDLDRFKAWLQLPFWARWTTTQPIAGLICAEPNDSVQ